MTTKIRYKAAFPFAGTGKWLSAFDLDITASIQAE
jgi:hypothetical protein